MHQTAFRKAFQPFGSKPTATYIFNQDFPLIYAGHMPTFGTDSLYISLGIQISIQTTISITIGFFVVITINVIGVRGISPSIVQIFNHPDLFSNGYGLIDFTISKIRHGTCF